MTDDDVVLLVKDITETVRTQMEQEGAVFAQFLLFNEQGQMWLVMLRMENEEAKDASALAVRDIAVQHEATVAAFVSEVWFVERPDGVPPGVAPMDCLDRKEKVQLMIERPGHKHEVWTAPILRKDGAPPMVGDFEKLNTAYEFVGRFTNVLPENDAEARAWREQMKTEHEQIEFVAKSMNRALKKGRERLGMEHPAMRRFIGYVEKVMASAGSRERLTHEERLVELAEFAEIYREITGEEMPHMDFLAQRSERNNAEEV